MPVEAHVVVELLERLRAVHVEVGREFTNDGVAAALGIVVREARPETGIEVDGDGVTALRRARIDLLPPFTSPLEGANALTATARARGVFLCVLRPSRVCEGLCITAGARGSRSAAAAAAAAYDDRPSLLRAAEACGRRLRSPRRDDAARERDCDAPRARLPRRRSALLSI